MRVCTSCFRCYDDDVERCFESDHFELEVVRDGGCESIAGYRLEQFIEKGSNWSLFRARQIEFGHSCLIRIFSSNENVRESFLNEAKAAVTFFNSNITNVYEAGSLDGDELFVASEDSHDQTLRDLLKNVGVPQLLTSVQIIRQAAEAVHALHLAGILHRAIRPENILLASDAEHRLTVKIQNPDLGGVFEHSIVSNKFTIDSSIASIRYFAPELFSNGSSCPQTDIYSLGIVFYELLTGAPPFNAPTASGLIEQHRHQAPPDVNINNFDLRMLVTHSLMAALHKQPETRQTSANALARQLRHVEQLATHSPTPPPAVVDEPRQPAPIAVAATTPIRKIQVPPSIDIDHILLVKGSEPQKPVLAPEKTPAVAIVESEISALPHPMPAVVYTVSDHEKRSENQPSVDQTKLRQRVGDPLPENKPSAASLPPPSVLRSRRRRAHHQNALTIETNRAAESDVERNASEPPAAIQEFADAEPMQPRELGWARSDDDIPMLDDVQAIPTLLPVEGSALGLVRSQEKLPRKVEWLQLDDDIPTLDDVKDALVAEKAFFEQVDEQAYLGQYLVTASPVTANPKKVDWLQLDDDIPSLEDVEACLRDDEIPTGREPFPAAPIVSMPLELIPKRQEKIVPFQNVETTATRYDDREEITIVSPRSNLIRIDLESVRPQVRSWTRDLDGPQAQNEIEFVPTIIATSRFARARDIRSFSSDAYSRPSLFSEPFIYRSTMVAGGVAIFVLVSLIASFVVTDSVFSSRVDKPDTVRSAPGERSVIEFTQPRAAEPTKSETVEKVEQSYVPSTDRLGKEEVRKGPSIKIDDRTLQVAKPVVTERPKPIEATLNAKPKPPPNSPKSPSVGDAKTNSTKVVERRYPSKNSGFATRPRIVRPE